MHFSELISRFMSSLRNLLINSLKYMARLATWATQGCSGILCRYRFS